MSEVREITEFYRLEKVLKSSTTGVVFRAVDPKSGARVVIKLINRGGLADQEACRKRFFTAAGVVKALQPKSFPAIHDFGITPDGTAFLVMSFLKVADAETLVGQPATELVPLITDVATGLETLAARGITHQNVSLSNLGLVEEGETRRLVCFGFGTAAFRAVGPGGIALRAHDPFAAPEQLAAYGSRPAAADWRSDLYSLGVVLAHLMGASVEPSEEGEPSLTLSEQSTVGLAKPDALGAILESCLRTKPERRPASYLELRTAFADAMGAPAPSIVAEKTQIVTLPEPEPLPSEAAIEAPPPETTAGIGEEEVKTIFNLPLERTMAIAPGMVEAAAPAGEPAGPAVPKETLPAPAEQQVQPDWELEQPKALEEAEQNLTRPIELAPPELELQEAGPAEALEAEEAPAADGEAWEPGKTVRLTPLTIAAAEAAGHVILPEPTEEETPAVAGAVEQAAEEPVATEGESAPVAPPAVPPIPPVEPGPPEVPSRAAEAEVRRLSDTNPVGKIPIIVPPRPIGTVPPSPIPSGEMVPPGPPPPPPVSGAVPTPPPVMAPPPPVAPSAPSFATPPPDRPTPAVADTPPPSQAPSVVVPAPPPAAPAPVEVPPPAAPAPAAPAQRPAAARKASAAKAGRSGKLPLWAWLVPVAVVLVAVAAFVGSRLVSQRRTAEVAVAPSPVPPTPTAVPQATQPPAGMTQLQAAQAALDSGDIDEARRILDGISNSDLGALGPDGQAAYRNLSDELTKQRVDTLVKNLDRGLTAGNVDLVRRTVASLSQVPGEELPVTAKFKEQLATGRQIASVNAAFTKAVKEKDQPEILSRATDLLMLAPRWNPAMDQRDRAAAVIEAEADSLIKAGQFEAGMEKLQTVKMAWPDRPGLAQKIERYNAEHEADQRFRDVLAAAAKAEQEKVPEKGLDLLARTSPTGAWEARFREERERLTALLAQLDKAPPNVQLAAGSKLEYSKNKPAMIQLQITDDHGVKSVTAFARLEDEKQFKQLPVRHVSGADYTLEVPASFHQNKTVELYVTAADYSGHVGQLGRPEAPLKLKKKGWLF